MEIDKVLPSYKNRSKLTILEIPSNLLSHKFNKIPSRSKRVGSLKNNKLRRGNKNSSSKKLLIKSAFPGWPNQKWST